MNYSSINSLSNDNDYNKPKRQRRSYSCGQCKKLKIKCDLKIPCSSCVKFKRPDKCLSDPPQPPLEEEFNKIRQRKSRSAKKKQQQQIKMLYGYEPIIEDYDRPLYSPVAALPGAPVLPHPQPMPAQLPPAPSIPPVPPPYYYPYMAAPAPAAAPTAPGHAPLLEYDYDYRDRVSSTDLLYVAYQLSVAHTRTPVFAYRYSTPNIHSFKTLRDAIAGDTATVELSADDARDLVAWYPLASPTVVAELFEAYQRSQQDLMESLVDLDAIFAGYQHLMELVAREKGPVVVDLVVARHTSLALLVMMSGLLFMPASYRVLSAPAKAGVTEKWLALAKLLKNKHERHVHVHDYVFLTNWYFLIRNYYFYVNTNIDNYLEFNKMLSYVLLNEDYVSILKDRPTADFEREISALTGGRIVPGLNDLSLEPSFSQPFDETFHIFVLLWLHLRVVELRSPLFQIKGTLLTSNLFKDAIVPHRRALAVIHHPRIFEEPITNLAVLQHCICAAYYKRFQNVVLVTEMISLYLRLYREVHDLIYPRVKAFEHHISHNPQAEITGAEVSLLIEIQFVLNLFVRWMSFVKLEQSYFASLRYASFITSMVALFNSFLFVDDLLTHRGHSLVQLMLREHSYLFVATIFENLIFQGLFLCLLANFIGYSDTAIDLDVIFQKVTTSYQNMLASLAKGGGPTDFHDAMYGILNINHVPLFRDMLVLGYEFNKFLSNAGHFTKCESFNEFVPVLRSHLLDVSWRCLTETIFGSGENLNTYCGKVWDLFRYFKVTPASSTIVIGERLSLDMGIIEDAFTSFTGLHLTDGLIEEYMRIVVKLHLGD